MPRNLFTTLLTVGVITALLMGGVYAFNNNNAAPAAPTNTLTPTFTSTATTISTSTATPTATSTATATATLTATATAQPTNTLTTKPTATPSAQGTLPATTPTQKPAANSTPKPEQVYSLEGALPNLQGCNQGAVNMQWTNWLHFGDVIYSKLGLPQNPDTNGDGIIKFNTPVGNGWTTLADVVKGAFNVVIGPHPGETIWDKKCEVRPLNLVIPGEVVPPGTPGGGGTVDDGDGPVDEG